MRHVLALGLLVALVAAVSCESPREPAASTERTSTPAVEKQVEGRKGALAIPHDSAGEEDVFETAWLKLPRETDVRPGGRRDLPIVVERRGFEVPLYFRCENLPPGVRVLGVPRISAEGDRVLITLVAASNAPLCRQVFRIVATDSHGSIQGTRLVRLTVRD